MKTITLVAFKRPELLRRVVDSLQANNTVGYSLVAVLDAGADPECFRIVSDIGFVPKHVVALDVHHGVDYINKHAYETALCFGSELNIAVEEDTPLSPDCLDLVNWWSENVISRHSVLNCFTFSKTKNDLSKVDIVDGDKFNGWVWASRRKLLAHFCGRWNEHGNGWDVSLKKSLRESGIKCVVPALARSGNIGPIGVHYNPALHAQHFEGCVMSDGSVREYVFA